MWNGSRDVAGDDAEQRARLPRRPRASRFGLVAELRRASARRARVCPRGWAPRIRGRLRMRDTVVIETPLARATSRRVTDARGPTSVRGRDLRVQRGNLPRRAGRRAGGMRCGPSGGHTTRCLLTPSIGAQRLSSSANVKRPPGVVDSSTRRPLRTAPHGRRDATGGAAVASYPDFSLDGRTTLVTGAARGLGRTIALSLAHAGCRCRARATGRCRRGRPGSRDRRDGTPRRAGPDGRPGHRPDRPGGARPSSTPSDGSTCSSTTPGSARRTPPRT